MPIQLLRRQLGTCWVPGPGRGARASWRLGCCARPWGAHPDGEGPFSTMTAGRDRKAQLGGRPASPPPEGRGQERTRGAGGSRVRSWQVSRVARQRRHGRHPWQGGRHPPRCGRNGRYVSCYRAHWSGKWALSTGRSQIQKLRLGHTKERRLHLKEPWKQVFVGQAQLVF